MGITGEHATQEARRLDDLAKADEKDTVEVSLLRAIVKGVAVAVKLLITIRGNQVTGLVKKYGREILRTPRRPATDENSTNDAKE